MTEPEAAKAVGAARLFIAISHNEILNDDCLPGLCQGKQGNEYVWETQLFAEIARLMSIGTRITFHCQITCII